MSEGRDLEQIVQGRDVPGAVGWRDIPEDEGNLALQGRAGGDQVPGVLHRSGAETALSIGDTKFSLDAAVIAEVVKPGN